MSEAKMTSKGQITVPKDVRLKLNLKPGDRIGFIIEADGRVRLRAAKRDISSLVGILLQTETAPPLEEMDEAIAQAAAEDALGHDRD